MKRTSLFRLLLPLLAVSLSACKEKNDEPFIIDPVETGIDIEPAGTTQIADVPAEGATLTELSIVSNAPWVLKDAPDFCTVEPSEGGDGKTDLVIIVAPNEVGQPARSGVLVFHAEGEDAGTRTDLAAPRPVGSAEVTLTISQLAGPEPEPEPEPGPEITDLDAAGGANAYVVTAPGLYQFKADNQYNLGEGLPVPPTIAPVSAGLVWQTVNGSFASVELVDGHVVMDIAEAAGNAVVAVYDEDGSVVWSWHIWMPAEEVASVTAASGYEVMNMNLGAMNNTPGDPASYGMLYQWGRKDPFPASATLTGTTATVSAPMYDIDGESVAIGYSSWTNTKDNTLDYAIAHPTVCLSNYSQFASSRDWLAAGTGNDALWGNPEGDYRDSETNTYPNKGVKSCYDPCPAGWRVAPADVFRHFTTSGGYAWTYDDFNVADINGDGQITLDDYNYGWHFMIGEDTPMYFPAAARFDGSYAMLMGSMSGLWGSYWSNAPYSGLSGGGFVPLAFQIKDQYMQDMVTVSASGGGSRADAYSVRCVRD